MTWKKEAALWGTIVGIGLALFKGSSSYAQAKGEPGEDVPLPDLISTVIDMTTIGARQQIQEALSNPTVKQILGGTSIESLTAIPAKEPQTKEQALKYNPNFVKYRITHVLPVAVKNDKELEAMLPTTGDGKKTCDHWSAANSTAIDLFAPKGTYVVAVDNGTYTTRARPDLVGTYDIFLQAGQTCYTMLILNGLRKELEKQPSDSFLEESGMQLTMV